MAIPVEVEDSQRERNTHKNSSGETSNHSANGGDAKRKRNVVYVKITEWDDTIWEISHCTQRVDVVDGKIDIYDMDDDTPIDIEFKWKEIVIVKAEDDE